MDRRKPLRSSNLQSASTAGLQSKLSGVISRHEELKISFNGLNSQVRAGLLEAEEVFASLAVPLMKLVGLKTSEMASENRFSTIITSVEQSYYQDDNFASSIMTAGHKLVQRQNLRLMQLIKLLKSIESHVNSSHSSIYQSLTNHQESIKQVFRKALSYVYAIHQSNDNKDLSLVMFKLLKATYEQVGAALGSVEGGVDDLIHELAEKMCKPMVKYVNDVKVEIKEGTCSDLRKLVKEMDVVMKGRNFELEAARKRAKLAEESISVTLSKLLKSQENARQLTMSLKLLTEDCIELESTPSQHQIPSVKEDHAKDDNLLWDLLTNKGNSQKIDSSSGHEGHLGLHKYDRRLTRSQTNSLQSSLLAISQAKGTSPQSLLLGRPQTKDTSPQSLVLTRSQTKGPSPQSFLVGRSQTKDTSPQSSLPRSQTKRPSPQSFLLTRSQTKRPSPQSTFMNSRMMIGYPSSEMTQKTSRKRRTP